MDVHRHPCWDTDIISFDWPELTGMCNYSLLYIRKRFSFTDVMNMFKSQAVCTVDFTPHLDTLQGWNRMLYVIFSTSSNFFYRVLGNFCWRVIRKIRQDQILTATVCICLRQGTRAGSVYPEEPGSYGPCGLSLGVSGGSSASHCSQGDPGTVVFELAGKLPTVQLVKLHQLDQVGELGVTIVQTVEQLAFIIYW